jgi:hypothetical protein
VHPTLGNSADDGASVHQIGEDLLGERIEALASWIQELDAQMKAGTVAGDEKTLKELRRALEAWSKRDPKFEDRLTDRVDVLADRLATLSSVVNTTTAAHVGSDGEIASLRRDVEQQAAKLDAALREPRPGAPATDLEDLKRAVARLGAERGSKNGDKGATALQEKVDNLAERLDTLAKTVATTAAGLAGREGELAGLRRMLDEGTARVDELARILRLETDHSDAAELRRELGTLGQKLTGGLADRDRRTAALEKRVGQEGARLEAFADSVRASVEALKAKIDALESDRDTGEALADLDERVRLLDGRVETVAQALEGASADLSDKELELAALQRHLEETGTRVDVAVAEVRATLAALAEAVSPDELDARLASVSVELAEVVGRLDAGEAHTSERQDRESARTTDLELQLADVASRLDEVEGARSAAAAELARSSVTWAEEQTALREQLAALERAVAESQEVDLEPKLAALRGHVEETKGHLDAAIREVGASVAERLADVERAREESADALAQVSDSWAEERRWVRDQLDMLVLAVAETGTDPEVEAAVQELPARLEELESAAERLASDVARGRANAESETRALRDEVAVLQQAFAEQASETESETVNEIRDRVVALEHERSGASTEIEALATRLERVESRDVSIAASEDQELKQLLTAFADRIDAMERDRPRIAAEASEASEQGLGDLHDLVGALRARIDSSEKEIAALAESASSPQAAAAGDGRFRVELRALELRMQHAEAAARENREAVLVQLERLASRIEWRLQRLEAADQDTQSKESAAREALGEVVPLRGGVEK